MSKECKEIRKLSYDLFISRLHQYSDFTRLELKAELKRTDATCGELICAKIVIGAVNGKKDCRQTYLERLYGKVKEEVKEEAKNLLSDFLMGLSPSELLELLKTATDQAGDKFVGDHS